jgi:hypothetical protein
MRRAQECVLALALRVTGRAQKDAEAPNATVIGDVTFRKLSENRGKSLITRAKVATELTWNFRRKRKRFTTNDYRIFLADPRESVPTESLKSTLRQRLKRQ